MQLRRHFRGAERGEKASSVLDGIYGRVVVGRHERSARGRWRHQQGGGNGGYPNTRRSRRASGGASISAMAARCPPVENPIIPTTFGFKMPFRRISACQAHGVLGVLERHVNEVQWPNFNGSPRCSPGSRLPVLSPPERWGRVRRLRWRLQRAFGDYRRLYGKIVVELRDSDSHMRPCRSVWARNRNPSIVVT